MNKKKLIWQVPFLLLLIIGTVVILKKQPPFRTNEGMVFGTIYKITYQHNDDLQNDIKAAMMEVDNSLSPYNPSSIITRINHNEDTVLNEHFVHVFNLAQQISSETEGAFDITVAPLVNAWGFGFKHSIDIEPSVIDSLRQFVGYQKIKLEDGKIIKEDERTMLDCSAIAKGYGVDRVARLLDQKGVKNYMVDIGGEVVLKGKNPRMKNWRIGINKPVEDSLSVNQELQTILEVSDVGMATSGNYRKFYYKDGKRYAHTIDPRIGTPVQHNILSATVIAKDCMSADAYATAFMVMGLEKAKAFCEAHPELHAYFICDGEGESYEIFATPGMEKFIVKR
ncbi:MAG: FAD:protein FMN transferase [Bacteroides sp.]|nr:FAD:protein FMN transferase [Bacteroides sp.]MBQ8873859.1 FAD:protein FMN transferase [Bacteroides sp.]